MRERGRERTGRGGRRGDGLPSRRAEGSARRAEGAPARRPRQVRREPVKARLRRGLGANPAGGAAKVLGMSTTRRAAVLAIVVCALAFTLAVPLRTYLSQRSEIAEQEQRQAGLKREVAELQSRQAAASDPAQVQAEARRRLRYVMPGETPYLVQLPEDNPQPQEQQHVQKQAGPGDAAWYDQLWSTLGG
ncbi:septum formation initiator family protein [Amycolatopsis acidicola]|uniref:Septum formation initiator family protein n=1 Tax=Amycolatopsis acidicola TaxID=2596893 RepID=A0A5N0UZE9_9PSEU|nr:septum formation initiator family protein [Amycolatopsis acidicola]KAA9157080.1 septum formation initiator family protein [Amycolatopsis acidicola]